VRRGTQIRVQTTPPVAPTATLAQATAASGEVAR
jgi:hypothetical protein